MQICFQTTPQQNAEVKAWVKGTGPFTKNVREVVQRNGLTFGIILITRQFSDGFKNN